MARPLNYKYDKDRGSPKTKPMESYDWLNLIILLAIAGLITGYCFTQIFN